MRRLLPLVVLRCAITPVRAADTPSEVLPIREVTVFKDGDARAASIAPEWMMLEASWRCF